MFKNEEEILERCINSVKPFVDGFLLVDTGSTDKSIKISKKYTKNIHTIQFTDFVESKNKVLDLADKLDYEYILWMDADEYFDIKNKTIINHSIKDFISTDKDIMVNFIQDYHYKKIGMLYERPRIWKNHIGIKFEGPGIHEFIGYNYQTNAKLYRDFLVYHEHKKNGKDWGVTSKFYLKILHAHVDKNPDDIRGLFYIARTYKDMHINEDAIQYYQKYRNVCNKLNYVWYEEYWYTLYEEADANIKLDRFKQAEKLLLHAIEVLPDRAEAYEKLMELYIYKTNDEYKALEVGKKAFNITINPNYRLFINKWSYQYAIYDNYALACWGTENYQNGYDAIIELLKLPNSELYHPDRINSNLELFKNMLWYKKETFHVNSYFDKIFCINLDKREDRWNSVSKKFRKLSINAKKFKAYDGELLTEFVDPNILVRRTPGYLGCLLSHLEIIKNSYNKGYDKILILEDDIAIHKYFNEYFSDIINQINHDNNQDWDLIYFGHCSYNEPYKIGNENGTYTLDNNKKYPKKYSNAIQAWGCHAYALSRNMMKSILDYYKENGYIYELDRVLTSEFQNNPNYKIYMTFPQLFMQNDSSSDNTESGNGGDHFQAFMNIQHSKKDDYLL